MRKSRTNVVYTRNIQGVRVSLQLIEADPDKVKLDTTNPRLSFSMSQLNKAERNDPAATLLLTSQEDTEGLKRSIILSGGVQEPVYLRHDYTVAEGNRRVVAMRAAKEEHPEDPRFKRMPAWLIPKGIPEGTIQDLLNEIHLGSVRGWAPYEKALQMRALIKIGLVEEEVAERYRMTSSEVRAQIAAAEMMDREYFPITTDPKDPQHRAKFSYILEFLKNSRLRAHADKIKDLPTRFSKWVRDDKIPTGAKVRRLPKILDVGEAMKLLEVSGFDAADEYIAKQNPREQELYLVAGKGTNPAFTTCRSPKSPSWQTARIGWISFVAYKIRSRRPLRARFCLRTGRREEDVARASLLLRHERGSALVPSSAHQWLLVWLPVGW